MSVETSVSEKPSNLCDLSSFSCKCGDIDVIGCRCNEWPRNCSEKMSYDESVCRCVEVSGFHGNTSIISSNFSLENVNFTTVISNPTTLGVTTTLKPSSSSSKGIARKSEQVYFNSI